MGPVTFTGSRLSLSKWYQFEGGQDQIENNQLQISKDHLTP